MGSSLCRSSSYNECSTQCRDRKDQYRTRQNAKRRGKQGTRHSLYVAALPLTIFPHATRLKKYGGESDSGWVISCVAPHALARFASGTLLPELEVVVDDVEEGYRGQCQARLPVQYVRGFRLAWRGAVC